MEKLREIDIQPTDRVVFIHIPKTAGITFSTILDPLLSGLPRCQEILLEMLVLLDLEEMVKYQVFMGHFPYKFFKTVFPSGFLSLTFLREPIGRTISNFRYLQRQEKLGGPPEREVELRANLSLKLK